jgi:uncharacterized protein
MSERAPNVGLVEWDPRKAKSNEKKHGVSFLEAVSVFGDPLDVTFADLLHSQEEERFITIGQSFKGQILYIAYTTRGGRVRIITARKATRQERRDYEEGSQNPR